MSYGYLEKMLEMLTSAYTRRDLQNLRHNQPLETNIGKVFSLFASGLEIIRENAELVRLWDNIDNAEGAVLDRYGANFGVERGAASDGLYRILIRVKMIAQLSGGDDDTVIRAAGELLGVDFSDILLEDVFPAKKALYVDQSLLSQERLDQAHPRRRRRPAALSPNLPNLSQRPSYFPRRRSRRRFFAASRRARQSL